MRHRPGDPTTTAGGHRCLSAILYQGVPRRHLEKGDSPHPPPTKRRLSIREFIVIYDHYSMIGPETQSTKVLAIDETAAAWKMLDYWPNPEKYKIKFVTAIGRHEIDNQGIFRWNHVFTYMEPEEQFWLAPTKGI